MANQYSPPIPVAERFWKWVDSSGGSESCWPWSGSRRGPYGGFTIGSLRLGNKARVHSHRIAWELTHGPIPQGLCVLHHCDNPPCCNPSHLWVGTIRQNNEDCAAKGRTSRNHQKGVPGDRNPMRMYPGILAGERNGRAKLTEPQVAQIMERSAAGESRASLGREYGVSPEAIHHIAKGLTWKRATLAEYGRRKNL